MRPLEPGERRRLIGEYLGQYTKRLAPDSLEQVADAEQGANPLLRTLLEAGRS